MIKEHAFTSLLDILRTGNDDVVNIFDNYSVQKDREKPIQSSPRMLEMIVATNSTNMVEAETKIKRLLEEITKCGNDYFSVFQKISEVLTVDGMGKLLTLMKEKMPEDFLKEEGGNIQYLFKGMPVFKVKVVDRKWLRSRATGRYDVYFVHSGSNVMDTMPIKFDTKEAKALYLLFLLMPRREIKNITGYNEILKELILSSFDYDDETFEKLYDAKDFKDVVKDKKSMANRNISSALHNRDEEQWYIIDFYRSSIDKRYYSLSLPEEMIDLSESPELLKFKTTKIPK